jgi:transcriptional regulator with XRE-family HTH domain
MDAQRLGAVLRAVRIRRDLRQSDVARLARVTDATVSRIERGHWAPVAFGTLDAVAGALDVTIDHRPWSRGGDLDRLVNVRHAALVEDLIETMTRHGWTARPEASFNERGERGLVDVLAWHARQRALLVIEVKTEIVDVGELLGTLDRKRRLAPIVARRFGWTAVSDAQVSVALIVGESATNRRRAQDHAASIRAALPGDGRQLRGYLRDPRHPVAVAAFWPYRHAGMTKRGWSAVRRVRRSGRGRPTLSVIDATRRPASPQARELG